MSWSISQRYRYVSGNPDPDPHQNVTDPQPWRIVTNSPKVGPHVIFSICLQVSKSWNVLALDGSNWQKVDFFEFQVDVDSGVVENLARRCGGFLKVLSLSGCQVRASFPKGIVA